MPSKKKKYNARFPPARIKKIMQTDEEVGKVAAAVPVIISRSLELFIDSLIEKTAVITKSRNAKTLTATHIKQTIHSEKTFDFLHDLVANVPDHQPDDDGDGSGTSTIPVAATVAAEPKPKRVYRPRKPREDGKRGPGRPKKVDIVQETNSASGTASENDDESDSGDEDDVCPPAEPRLPAPSQAAPTPVPSTQQEPLGWELAPPHIPDSSQAHIQTASVVGTQPHLQASLGVGSQPYPLASSGVDSQPNPQASSGVGTQPHLQTPGVSSQPHLQTSLCVGSQPHPQTSGVGTQPHLQNPGVGTQSHLLTPGVGTQPHLQTPGVDTQLHPRTPSGTQPHLQTPGVCTQPHLQTPGVGTQPHPPASSGVGTQPHLQSPSGVGTQPHLQTPLGVSSQPHPHTSPGASTHSQSASTPSPAMCSANSIQSFIRPPIQSPPTTTSGHQPSGTVVPAFTYPPTTTAATAMQYSPQTSGSRPVLQFSPPSSASLPVTGRSTLPASPPALRPGLDLTSPHATYPATTNTQTPSPFSPHQLPHMLSPSPLDLALRPPYFLPSPHHQGFPAPQGAHSPMFTSPPQMYKADPRVPSISHTNNTGDECMPLDMSMAGNTRSKTMGGRGTLGPIPPPRPSVELSPSRTTTDMPPRSFHRPFLPDGPVANNIHSVPQSRLSLPPGLCAGVLPQLHNNPGPGGLRSPNVGKGGPCWSSAINVNNGAGASATYAGLANLMTQAVHRRPSNDNDDYDT